MFLGHPESHRLISIFALQLKFIQKAGSEHYQNNYTNPNNYLSQLSTHLTYIFREVKYMHVLCSQLEYKFTCWCCLTLLKVWKWLLTLYVLFFVGRGIEQIVITVFLFQLGRSILNLLERIMSNVCFSYFHECWSTLRCLFEKNAKHLTSMAKLMDRNYVIDLSVLFIVRNDSTIS